jgi:tetratricopeptide (TPR) repeat protein
LPPAEIHYEIGRQYYHEAIKEENDNPPQLASMDKKAFEEKLEKAFQEFQKAVELDAEHEDAYYGLGVVYLELGHLKQSAEAFTRVLEINPASKKARKALRVILEQVE